MNHAGKVDQDDIVRARSVLLASECPTPREAVDAYRVLARVSPTSYLPRLAEALHRLSYDPSSGTKHPASLALHEEAVAAARSMDPADPVRANALYWALSACQRELYALGRRAEGLAMRAEMLAVGRARAELSGRPAVGALRTWAAGLSEEGRYAEAADAMTEVVAAELPGGPRGGDLAWPLLEWIAALHDAGRSDEALAAFGTLVAMEASEAANERGSTECHFYALIGYAQMLDVYHQGERAAAVRHEALGLLTELAEPGARKCTSGYHLSFWAVLLSFSSADSGRTAPGGPRPPSGATPMEWSPDARRRYFDSRHTLRDEVDALAQRAAEHPDQHLAELVRLHRMLTVRSAVYWEDRSRKLTEQVRSLFNDGVDLARRLSQHDTADGTRTLAETLIDRSTFHTAVRASGPALDDFRQALRHLGEAD